MPSRPNARKRPAICSPYPYAAWDVPEEQFARFSGPYLNGHFQPRRARPCWACPNHHCTLMTITEGPHAGLEIEEPEYEQLSAFSANLDIAEVGSVAMLGNTVDFEQFGLPARLHPYDPELIARFEARMRGGMQLEDSAVTCRFNTRTRIELLARSVAAVTGWDFGFDEALAVGRRAIHTLRAFNLRSGLGSDLEAPSPRYGSTPVDGPAEGLSIEPHLAEMLRIYYEGMGWDERGRPRPETLRAFGLDGIARDLWGPAE